ncbi:MAG: sulfurtransferase FdhD [Gemmatimonadetes bacterium]|nr:sulfurtransferase FdhD [Gemmatimonadota bacterium]
MQIKVHGVANGLCSDNRWFMQLSGHISPTVPAEGIRLEHGGSATVHETLAEETPVTFAYNGVSHAVMMATPADFEDFAVGFSLTEGIVARMDLLSGLSVVRYSGGIELQMETSAEVASDARRRRLTGRTGCGICGKEDVRHVLRDLPHVDADIRFEADAIARAMCELAGRQPLNDATGAVHAAGWASTDGAILLVREDVGRHNALDKLIGALVRGAVDPSSGFIVLTSRGSFELVQKAAIFGAPLLATISAPTGLAVRVAGEAGLTLAGFARDGRVTVYTHPRRVS